jgi:hypothetical protein
MQGSDFAWDRSYVVPASLRFLLTPAGSLQADRGVGMPSVEVRRDWVVLLLGFAQAQTAEAAYAAASEEVEIDRESWQAIVRVWIAQGLLQVATARPPVPARLGVFMQATKLGTRGASPLRSHLPLQQPLEFYPGLDTREIHDGARFPWVAELEAAFPLIREEFARLVDGGAGFSPVYREQTSAGEWAASFLWSFGQRVEDVCRRCPETARLLSAIPGVAEFGTTLYSALAPHTHIAPHYGLTNAKLRCQLPLRVPGRCRLKVGEHEVEQREGRCIVFDDSFLHSAWNDSDEPRFVLVFDFYHPDLAAEEIDVLLQLARERQLAQGYLEPTAAGRRVGWVGPRAASPDAPPPDPS